MVASVTENGLAVGAEHTQAGPDDVCKYCRQSGTTDRPLFYPCKCSGTMRYVHEDCLKTWLDTVQSTRCEVCNFSFRFESIWKVNTPEQLPISDIVHGLVKSLQTVIALVFHRTLVVLMWLIILPLSVEVLYEAAFPADDDKSSLLVRMWKMGKLFNLTHRLLSLNVSFTDWYTGVAVVMFNCLTVVGMLYLREQLLQVLERTRNEHRRELRDEMEQENRQLRDAIQVALRQVENENARPPMEGERSRDQATQLRIQGLARAYERVGRNVNHAANAILDNPQNNNPPGTAAEPPSSDVDPTLAQQTEQLRALIAGTQQTIDRLENRLQERLQREERERHENLLAYLDNPAPRDAFEFTDDSMTSEPPLRRVEEAAPRAEQPDVIGEYPRVHNLRRYSSGRTALNELAGENGAGDQGTSERERNAEPLMMAGYSDDSDDADYDVYEDEMTPGSSSENDGVESGRESESEISSFFGEGDSSSQNSDWLDTPDPDENWGQARRLFDQNPALAEQPLNPDEAPAQNLGPNDPPIQENPNVIQLDITWQRIIGIDGSYRFFEHVLYAFVLNGLALWALWFVPMNMGKLVFTLLVQGGAKSLPRLVIPIKIGFFVAIGYVSFTTFLGIFGRLRRILYIRKRVPVVYIISRFAHSVYQCLKVALLMTNELIMYPTVIGFWINLCSINLIGNTLEWRMSAFEKNPLTYIFFHWLAGMVVVFQFVSGVITIRKVTRPGLIWFVRNLEDHDYSPLKDMLESTFLVHIKRFCYTCALLGWCIFVCIWIPTEFVRQNKFISLPFSKAGSHAKNVSSINGTVGVNGTLVDVDLRASDDVPERLFSPIAFMADLPKHFILLQILVPMLNMDGQRIGKKLILGFISIWCTIVGHLLGIRSYLTGIEKNPDESGPRYQPVLHIHGRARQHAQDAGAHAFTVDPYRRKPFFHIRIIGFFACLVATLSVVFGACIFIPVITGRLAFVRISAFYSSQHLPQADTIITLSTNGAQRTANITSTLDSTIRAEEVVNAWVLGACLLWAPINILYMFFKFLRRTLQQARQLHTAECVKKLNTWAIYVAKWLGFFTVIGVVIPLILGLFASLIVVAPLKVDQSEDTLIYLTNDWIFGVLLQKIFVGICLIVPNDWGWREAIQRVYANGEPQLMYTAKLCFSVLNTLLVSWAVPYIIAHGVFPMIIPDATFLGYVQHSIYPTILAMLFGICVAKWHMNCFQVLCDRLKRSKYLVGNRLINNDG